MAYPLSQRKNRTVTANGCSSSLVVFTIEELRRKHLTNHKHRSNQGHLHAFILPMSFLFFELRQSADIALLNCHPTTHR